MVAWIASLSPLLGQETNGPDLGEIATDRPGFGTPANVLPIGVIQLESGFTVTSQSGQGTSVRTFALGSPLVRVGIGERFGLPFSGEGFVNSRITTSTPLNRSEGLSDFAIGAKIGRVDEHGWFPALSPMPVLVLPIGGRSITNSAFYPGLALDWSKSFPEKCRSWGTVGYTSGSEGNRRYVQRLSTVAFGHSVWAGSGATSKSITSVQTGTNATEASLLDDGFVHVLGKNAQIDLEAGRRFIRSTACWFASIGCVTRTGAPGHLLSGLVR
jgi:hypothetical protein